MRLPNAQDTRGAAQEPMHAHPENMIRLENVSKRFPGGSHAVDGLTLDVRKGEIFTLLGPSGCGKTTTLRMIAGLEQPDRGRIFLRDQVLACPARNISVPTRKRRMGMVFQSYAIWPHLTVESVAYPLRTREVHAQVNADEMMMGCLGTHTRRWSSITSSRYQARRRMRERFRAGTTPSSGCVFLALYHGGSHDDES